MENLSARNHNPMFYYQYSLKYIFHALMLVFDVNTFIYFAHFNWDAEIFYWSHFVNMAVSPSAASFISTCGQSNDMCDFMIINANDHE